MSKKLSSAAGEFAIFIFLALILMAALPLLIGFYFFGLTIVTIYFIGNLILQTFLDFTDKTKDNK